MDNEENEIFRYIRIIDNTILSFAGEWCLLQNFNSSLTISAKKFKSDEEGNNASEKSV